MLIYNKATKLLLGMDLKAGLIVGDEKMASDPRFQFEIVADIPKPAPVPVPPSIPSDKVKVLVRAKGWLADNVGPIMQVMIDGKIIGHEEIRATELTDYIFEGTKNGAMLDVVFTNDAQVGTEDRNMWVEYVEYDGKRIVPTTDSNVTYDKGTLDGLEVVEGRQGMPWGGALRFPLSGSTAPAPAPSTGTNKDTVPFFSQSTMALSSYPSRAAGNFVVQNNTWAARYFAKSGWHQSVGIAGPAVDGSIDFRMEWEYPAGTYPSGEVMGYPEAVYGRSASTYPAGKCKLPAKISQIKGVKSSYKAIDGSWIGYAHATYDLWTSGDPSNLAGGNRRAEIMLPEQPFPNGYGVPDSPAGTQPGRANQAKRGRNPHGYVGRETINQEQFDVYYFPGGSQHTGLAWQFIVFEPVNFPGNAGKARDWMPILAYCRTKGWVKPDEYLSSIEFGVEPIGGSYGGGKGDVTVRGFNVEVTV